MLKRFLVRSSSLVLVAALIAVHISARPAPAQAGPMFQQPLEQLSGENFDRAFLAAMAVHHAMAIMMARPVAANAIHPELQELATNSINDQTREIAQMREWASTWYGLNLPDPVAMMDSIAQARGQGMMPIPQGLPVMMSHMSMMDDLSKLPPQRLEAVFLSLMIPHHQGAVEMAMLVPDRAAHPELRQLAEDIIQSRSAEISTMNTWLSAWYGL